MERILSLAAQRGEVELLTETAHQSLVKALHDYGNVLTDAQSDNLRWLLENLSKLATGKLTGRRSFPLPCGGGKTQSVLHWIKAVHELDMPYSVMLAAAEVDALADNYEALVALGVPPEKIGMAHSKPPQQCRIPATPLPERQSRQFMLCTHARMRDQGVKLAQYGLYHGRPRDCVVFDESLLLSDTWAVEVGKLRSEVIWVKAQAEDDGRPETARVAEWAKYALGEIEKRLGWKVRKAPPKLELQPPGGPDDYALVRTAANRTRFPSPNIQLLLDHVDLPLRVERVSNSEGAIYWEPKVPDALQNILTLDASFEIRWLTRIGNNIAPLPAQPARPGLPEDSGFQVDYSQCRLRVLPHSAGIGSIGEHFVKHLRPSPNLSDETVALLRSLPENEPVNLWARKAAMQDLRSGNSEHRRGARQAYVDVLNVLASDLRRAGLDPEATCEVDGQTVSRWNFLTYGMGGGSNNYVHAKHTVFIGALYRTQLDIVADIRGQLIDKRWTKAVPSVQEVLEAEVRHTIYQCAARGSMRVIKNGKAEPHTIWLIGPDRWCEALRPLWPGLTDWGYWEPQAMDSRQITLALLTEALVDHVLTLPRDRPITTNKLGHAMAEAFPDRWATLGTYDKVEIYARMMEHPAIHWDREEPHKQTLVYRGE